MIKRRTQEEIEKIRSACSIAADILDEVSRKIKPGLTTKEIDGFIDQEILRRGAKPAFKGYRGYKNASCLSVNDEIVHGIPGDKVLKEGDIIGIDLGTIVNGYYGDIASTFAVGAISGDAKRLVDCAKKCLDLGINAAKSGNNIGDISYEIEKCATENGYNVVRDLFGHGVGETLHEDPLVPNFGKKGEGPRLENGMVFAIEPMINLGKSDIKTLQDGWTIVTQDGSLSAHFEHTIAINGEKPLVLTEK